MGRSSKGKAALKSIWGLVAYAIVLVWGFFESILFVFGIIGCLMLPVYWPMKFVYATLWLIGFFVVSKVIAKIQLYRERVKNSKIRK